MNEPTLCNSEVSSPPFPTYRHNFLSSFELPPPLDIHPCFTFVSLLLAKQVELSRFEVR